MGCDPTRASSNLVSPPNILRNLMTDDVIARAEQRAQQHCPHRDRDGVTCLPCADKHIADLVAECHRLRQERDALRVHHRLCQCQEIGEGLEDCTFRASATQATRRAEAAEAECRRLQEEVAATANAADYQI